MGELHESFFDPVALLAEDSLRKDTCTDLPMWLGKALTERHLTSMHTPAVYGEWMQRQVDAGAACISLKKHPYFYDVGMQCALM
eukprot:gene3391-3665_t